MHWNPYTPAAKIFEKYLVVWLIFDKITLLQHAALQKITLLQNRYFWKYILMVASESNYYWEHFGMVACQRQLQRFVCFKRLLNKHIFYISVLC